MSTKLPIQMTSIIKHCFLGCMCIADVAKQGPAVCFGPFAWRNETKLVQSYVYGVVLQMSKTLVFNTLHICSWPGGRGSSCQSPSMTERLKHSHCPTCGVTVNSRQKGALRIKEVSSCFQQRLLDEVTWGCV